MFTLYMHVYIAVIAHWKVESWIAYGKKNPSKEFYSYAT